MKFGAGNSNSTSVLQNRQPILRLGLTGSGRILLGLTGSDWILQGLAGSDWI